MAGTYAHSKLCTRELTTLSVNLEYLVTAQIGHIHRLAIGCFEQSVNVRATTLARLELLLYGRTQRAILGNGEHSERAAGVVSREGTTTIQTHIAGRGSVGRLAVDKGEGVGIGIVAIGTQCRSRIGASLAHGIERAAVSGQGKERRVIDLDNQFGRSEALVGECCAIDASATRVGVGANEQCCALRLGGSAAQQGKGKGCK